LVCLHCVLQLHNHSQGTLSLWVVKWAAVQFAAAASWHAALEA